MQNRHKSSELHIRKNGFKLARDLRIGEPFGKSLNRDGDRPLIKRLHEVCPQQTAPHVHVVTSEGSFCLAFTQPV